MLTVAEANVLGTGGQELVLVCVAWLLTNNGSWRWLCLNWISTIGPNINAYYYPPVFPYKAPFMASASRSLIMSIANFITVWPFGYPNVREIPSGRNGERSAVKKLTVGMDWSSSWNESLLSHHINNDAMLRFALNCLGRILLFHVQCCNLPQFLVAAKYSRTE